MTPKSLYALWKKHATQDADLVRELAALDPDQDSEELADRFGQNLSFGTGGLRGKIGAGTNRMNIYVIRRATQGLCNYIKSTGLPRAVAIGYDSRIKSSLFANEAAKTLAANGITAWIYPRVEPTPALSWAVRYLSCGAGICVTASHNPAQYNGYKVYSSDGCQITPDAARAILREIERLDLFRDISVCSDDAGRSAGLIRDIPNQCLDAYLDAVLAQRRFPEKTHNLKVVYTPLNGAGLECVTKALKRMGIQDLTVVPEQMLPDGNFPTCPRPNPEEPDAMARGLALCKELRPDLLLGTDPDCDRMGAAVPNGEEYVLLNGNEMGILLLDYICRCRIGDHSMPSAPVAVTTIVSTDMADTVAASYGVELRRVLTGFKYIGEQIGLLEAEHQSERYIFGFEESYGYLSGTYVRDKDAVNACVLCCEMTAWYKQQGKTLFEAMEALYQKYGYYRNDLACYSLDEYNGIEKMQQIMQRLRTNGPELLRQEPVIKTIDYRTASVDTADLPKSNVLEFRTQHSKIIVRPSGTEPKIKLYVSSVANSSHIARQRNAEILDQITKEYLL